MKKFFEEFKVFISRGNVLDLSVAVIVGAAFTSVVTSLTNNIINPLINCIGGADVQGRIKLVGDNYIDYGAVITAIINFIIVAFVIFCLVKAVNKLTSLGKKNEEESVPLAKVCPYCKSEVPIDATRCAHCTSYLEETE